MHHEGYFPTVQPGSAANMTPWYYEKNWPMIEQYVKNEAEDFVHAYSALKCTLPNIIETILPTQGI